MNKKIPIRLMTLEDYYNVHALWTSVPGVGLRDHEDSREGIAYYLRRNPTSCFVAGEKNKIIGVVLCGNDGRRGYINHLAVALEHRKRGIARALVNACRDAMRAEGIRMLSFVVFRENENGNAFWDALGATQRDELRYYNLPV